MSVQTTRAILDTVVTRLQAAQWTPSSGPAVAAFEAVALYTAADIVSAFRELLLSKRRIALVVYDGDDYVPAGSGAAEVAIQRQVSIAVLVTDRVVANSVTAALGSSSTPGAIGLAGIARDALAGPLLDDPEGVDCLPRDIELAPVGEPNSQQPGRVAAVLSVICQDRQATTFPLTAS